MPGAVDVRTGGGHAKYAPKWDKALYDANAGSDRDGDHIACEQ
ncbi:excalibur calcium-binding domain-containing protein [Aquihabitans sp. G128]|nr:excalibur calcium-binding domain-containing protein [Aquihabitans sp. G128]